MGHYFLWQILQHQSVSNAGRTIILDPDNYPMPLSGVPNRVKVRYFENTKMHNPIKKFPSQIIPFVKPALVCVEKAFQSFKSIPDELTLVLASHYSGQSTYFIAGSMLHPQTGMIADIFLGEASPGDFPSRLGDLRFNNRVIALEMLVDPTAISGSTKSQEEEPEESDEATLLEYPFETFLIAKGDEPRDIERVIQAPGLYYKHDCAQTIRFTAADIHSLSDIIRRSSWSKSLHPFLLAAGYALNESAQLQKPYSNNLAPLAPFGYPPHVLDCDIKAIHDVDEKYIVIVTEMPAGAREFMQKGQEPKAKIVRTYKINNRTPSRNTLENEKRFNV